MSALIKYKTGYHESMIDTVECIRETASCVYIAKSVRVMSGTRVEERREKKRAEYAQYHDSWVDAHTYLLKRAEGNVMAARQALDRANGTLGNVKGMKPPKVAP